MRTFHAWQRRMMAWQVIAFLPAMAGVVATSVVMLIDPRLLAGRSTLILGGTIVFILLLAGVMLVQGLRIVRLRNRVRERRGAVCIECLTDLPESEQGVCPSCSLAYTRVGNLLLWNIPDEAIGVTPPRRKSPAFHRRYKHLVVTMIAVAGLILLANTLMHNPAAGTISVWRMAGAPIAANLLGVGIMVVLVVRFMRTVQRERIAAIARRGAVCTKCGYSLPDDESGTCPECGHSYTRASNAEFWGISLIEGAAPAGSRADRAETERYAD